MMIYAFKRCDKVDTEPVATLQVGGPDGQTNLFIKATIDFNVGPEYVSFPYTGEDPSVIVDAFTSLNNSRKSHMTLVDLVIKWHNSFLRGVVTYALSKVDFDELQLTTQNINKHISCSIE